MSHQDYHPKLLGTIMSSEGNRWRFSNSVFLFLIQDVTTVANENALHLSNSSVLSGCTSSDMQLRNNLLCWGPGFK